MNVIVSVSITKCDIQDWCCKAFEGQTARNWDGIHGCFLLAGSPQPIRFCPYCGSSITYTATPWPPPAEVLK